MSFLSACKITKKRGITGGIYTLIPITLLMNRRSFALINDVTPLNFLFSVNFFINSIFLHYLCAIIITN